MSRIGELQPNTIQTMIRTIIGHMTDIYDWRMVPERDLNMEGGLNAMLNNLYAIRRELFGPEYGAHKKAVVKGASTTKDIDLDRFDLDKPRELQMALLVVCGGYLGFRGLSEHTNLVFGNWEKD